VPNFSHSTAVRPEPEATRLYCPVNFHPADRLRGRDRKLADGLVYLAHAIIMRRVLAPRSEVDGFFPLRSVYLKRTLGARRWPEVKRAALALGLVACDEKYIVGQRSKGYRLLEPYASAEWALRPIGDPRFGERIEKCQEGNRGPVWKTPKGEPRPVPTECVNHLWRNLGRICIDATIDEPLTNVTEVAADLIRRGAWRMTVDEYGRVHTNITNLKKTLRPYLSVDGGRVVNLDVSNSQPLFLGLLLCRENQEKKAGKGREGTLCGALDLCGALSGNLGNLQEYLRVEEYLRVCERGELYDLIASQLNPRPDRDTLKRRVLAALYDRDSHRNKVYDALAASFPGVMAALREVKRANFRRAAHLGQRTESDFIIGRCVGRLAREHPGLFVTTIHDSIMTTEGDEETVRGVMLEEFARLGVQPRVKVERCAEKPRAVTARGCKRRSSPNNSRWKHQCWTLSSTPG